MTPTPLSRRSLLTYTGLGGLAIGLAGCAATPGASTPSTTATAPTGSIDPNNPFGLKADSVIDAVIFDNANNVAFMEYVSTKLKELGHATLDVHPSAQIAQEVQPRFVAGNPPDLLHSAGSGAIPVAALLPNVMDLASLVSMANHDGNVISDAVFPGVLELANFDGKLAAINYSLTVHALWYSRTLFAEHGWEPPKTWDDAMALGAEAKKAGKYLFVWGKEASSYYLSLCIDSAIKEGGDEVRVALANLEPNSWSLKPLQDAFSAMKRAVDEGYFMPGGAGTQFKAAQAQWSLKQEAIMYPTGSWIEAEMGEEIAEGFEMVGAPNPTITPNSVLPYEAMRFAGGNRFLVPTDGANTAGALEALRIMLSKDSAQEFAKINKSMTILRDTVPDDGFGSTSLASAVSLLSAAGDNAYAWDFTDAYPFGDDKNGLMNDFLSGTIDVAEATQAYQKVADRIREDDSIQKIKAA